MLALFFWCRIVRFIMQIVFWGGHRRHEAATGTARDPPHPPPAGLDFAGVHDSFWTHAGTVEHMNSLLREKFVELHGQVCVGGGWGGPRRPLPPPPPLLKQPKIRSTAQQKTNNQQPDQHPPTHTHTQPLLENLLAEFQRQYPEVDLPPVPPRGELDLDGVRTAAYFFS